MNGFYNQKEEMIDSQLLCTFSNREEYENVILLIKECYDVLLNKIYILEDVENTYNLMLTYNVAKTQRMPETNNTISIHRKKHTNTLYTINAINELIKSANNGILDKSFKINWQNYTNQLLIGSPRGLKVVRTKLYKIINLN